MCDLLGSEMFSCCVGGIPLFRKLLSNSVVNCTSKNNASRGIWEKQFVSATRRQMCECE